MEMKHESSGSLSYRQEATQFIDPISANVIDTLDNPLGEIKVTARIDSINSLSDAEAAVIQTVHGEIGPGQVEVASALTDEVFNASLVQAEANEALVAEPEMSDTEFQADLAANGLAVYFQEDNADTAVAEGEVADPELDPNLAEIDDSQAEHTDEAIQEPEILIASLIGEIALHNKQIELNLDTQLNPEDSDSAPELSWQPEAIGSLLVSGMMTSEETASAVDSTHPDGDPDEAVEPDSSILQEAQYNVLRDLSHNQAISKLGELSLFTQTEIASEPMEDDVMVDSEYISYADMTIAALAPYARSIEERDDYMLAA
jgi:hypothetical protein